jgi:pyruvate dehydrogenase E2 component (dihydrolipoamide acetyltransferase)
MAHEIKMPQLSDTMDSGKILAWHKNEGDLITRGDILAEVETDKANLEIESFQSGTLLKVTISAGEVAIVGDIIAYIGEAGSEVPNGAAPSTGAPSTGAPSTGAPSTGEDSNVAKMETTAQKSTAPSVKGSTATEVAKEIKSPLNTGTPSAGNGDERLKASPLARKIAEQAGINISDVAGTGPGGRVVKRDIEAMGSKASSDANNAPVVRTNRPAAGENVTTDTARGTPSNGNAVGGTLTPLSKMRATIARRMQETVVQSPHFYIRSSICMDNLITLREQLKETQGYEKISLNHFIIKACSYALSKEPAVNCAMIDGMLFSPNGIHIGIVTAVKDGLLIPVIKNTNDLSVRDIAFEVRAAIDRARAGRPSSSDLTGGTFTISNMGMFDVDDFTALINPGQGAILAVSSTKETPVVRNGRIEIENVMNVTLSVDHRIIDGVMAGNFLKALKSALEHPTLMFLE